MNKLVMTIAFCLVFFAGYFTHSLFETSSAVKQPLAKNQEAHIKESIDKSAISISSAPSSEQKAVTQVSTRVTSVQNVPSATGTENKLNALAAHTSETSSTKEISDEEIDKLLSEPFNNQLKQIHGGLREKYRNFAESNTPRDWDVDMKNKLSAAIYSNPYSNYIKLDSLECRANLCEIRVYELKPNVWTNIQSGMALEPWWDIGSAHADGFNTDSGTGVYVLLVRR